MGKRIAALAAVTVIHAAAEVSWPVNPEVEGGVTPRFYPDGATALDDRESWPHFLNTYTKAPSRACTSFSTRPYGCKLY